MSWGRRNSSTGEPPKAKAFSDSMAYQIERAIVMTGMRMLVLNMEEFSFDELKLLFVEPDKRDFLTKAYQATKGHNINNMELFAQAPLNRCRIRFQWRYMDADGAFFVPRDEGGLRIHALTARADAPQELRERYEDMAERLERTSREWGLVRFVFTQLNQHGYCNTPPQMRYVWPAIPTLLNYAGLGDLAKTLAQPSSRAGDKARIPAQAAPYIRETYDIVTRSILVDNMNKLSTTHQGWPTIDIVDATFPIGFGDNQTFDISGI